MSIRNTNRNTTNFVLLTVYVSRMRW